MTRLKLVHIITGLRPGGAERLLLDMYAVSDRERFDVRLVSITGELTALDVYGYPDTPVEVFDLAGGNFLHGIKELRRFLRAFAPDVIHAHMFHSLVAAFIATRFLPRRPAICFTSHLNQYSPLRALATRALKPWRAADIIFSPDQHPALNAACAEVIPNGVFVGERAPERRRWDRGGKVRLLAVGRIADQKDPLGMLRSFAAARLPAATLEFVGAGPLMDEARALTHDLGLEGRVTFHGMRADVASFLDEADIFVMHSKYEGMPIALLEAAARAMPVVATPVGSVGDVVGGDCGVLTPPDGFADALAALAADPDRALAMGRRLHARALAHYSIAATTAAHERIYARIARA